MPTNSDIELALSRNIPEFLWQSGLLSKQYDCEARLVRGDRKKRSTAEFEWNWDPGCDSITIRIWPVADGKQAASPGVEAEPKADRLSDLVLALDRAERRPGYGFVSLKWFRDAALSRESFSWAADETARHDVIREAIDRRWILTGKIANPRPPHFPVTAIRLNRQMPEVSAVLGDTVGGPVDFRPVALRGETLSATVLTDRR